MASIELRRLAKSYGTVRVCDDIDLMIEDGGFVTLLGPSGCGKTTTLNIIAGVEDATSGDVVMDGETVNERSPFERDIAMVFQNYALYPHMTVAENIGFTLRLRKLPRPDIERQVDEVARTLELGHLLQRYPAQLSGGQQQRVAIGRAMVRHPKAFLFDEPFSNLDTALRVKMRAEVKLLHQRLGSTCVFVTHDQEEALSLSDRIAVLRAGTVEQYDTPEAIYARPATRYVAQFIGTPQLEFVAGAVASADGAPVFRAGALDLPLTPGIAAAIATRGAVELAARPEHVVPTDSGGCEAQVVLAQPVGPSTFLSLAWDGGALTARVPGMSTLRAGARLRFAVEPRHMMFFETGSGRRIPTDF